MSHSEPYPAAAFTLSLIGGIFVILAGLLVGLVGAAFTIFLGGIGAFAGILGVAWGIIIIVSAYNLRSNPSQHATWGAIILVFSLVSWFGAFGGFFIGFLLALIGGILAIVWSPPSRQPAYTQSYYAPSAAPAARYCPHCGRSVPLGGTFCPYCGKPLS